MNLTPLLNASPAIQLHLLGALMAIIATVLIFTHPRGRGLHRLYGWIWVLSMALAAGASLFIHSIDMLGGFSLIHILSILVLYGLVEGVYYIRIRRNIRKHRSTMLNMTLGGLVVAGVLSFLPSRLMTTVFF